MWLLEQPLYIVVIGIVVGILVGGAWYASGRKEFLYALGAVVVFTVAALVVERLVVTDAESIRSTLNEIARDVQSNDHQRLVAHISNANPSLVQRAEAEMPNYKFTECRVTKIHDTDVDASSEPRSAKVQFNVLVSGTFRQGGMEASGTHGRWVELHMVKEQDGRWRVQDYDHRPPQQFLFGQPLEDIER
jgi:hypothetical protein